MQIYQIEGISKEKKNLLIELLINVHQEDISFLFSGIMKKTRLFARDRYFSFQHGAVII